jgi:hypothetical protein
MDNGVGASRIETICRIPDDYYGWSRPSSNKSWKALLAASHYSELRPQLTAVQLAAHLHAHPLLVSQWERYSEDKRTSGGWYFVRSLDGWVLGRLTSAGARDERLVRAADPEACAEYILLELDWLAAIGDSSVPT